ncbi:hypothetical protein A1OQ_01060 [Enterovibrio norvegicus FF-162]|uniref:Nucleotide-diphospho-sugar transferase domain-containing protein n=1 Tax=Enterovibrio norvegicus FF-454 TaxID=1185651 RepID=A0A1E5CGV8_9GAMM|nr:hypothetical protein [Enterovibrio norvegicus]OEE64392.1 hypothetical protein A1OK_00305 [Enterovibrio norvegicus FF-454]OEE74574.1 hypothetical protein A1OQ_01060 [Enterovibrio norvegicus FF-162]
MILTLLTFGDRLENHYQASFAILTYLQSDLISKVCVVTDRPCYYKYFGDRVDVIEIDQNKMNEWRGNHDFFWRIKMKAIETAAHHNAGQDILYVDSDTFYVRDMEKIVLGLSQGNSFMHENEGKLVEMTSKTPRKMWQSLSGKTFSGVTINKETEMWNAGVIALSRKDAQHVISLAIDICDEICATDCPRRLVEQFAFSVALKDSTLLVAAENQIGHYWGNKPHWNEKIGDFFMLSILSGSSLEDDLKRIQHVDLDTSPTVYKEKSIKGKVKNFLDKIFPPKEVQYFKGRTQ